MSNHMKALEGKTIVGIDVSDDDSALRFRTSAGQAIVWAVYGDCCSHSYWHDGYSLDSLRDGTVVAAASLELPDVDSNDEGYHDELVQAYGYSIITDKGAATLAFRNSSNGYYGGDCSLGVDNDNCRWREITANDWQAGGPNDPPTRTPEEIAEAAAKAKVEKFRDEVRDGLAECRKQLRDVIPTLSSGTAHIARSIDAVVDLQDLPTTDIFVLGIYLTRRAEETLKAIAG